MKTVESGTGLPDWLPEDARNYLHHTETGQSLRALARASGCHASTVMRQIRKIEVRREDPLVDAALRRLGAEVAPAGAARSELERRECETEVCMRPDPVAETMDSADLRREAVKVLRLLGRPGTLMAVAQDMDKAVVVSEDGGGGAAARQLIVDAGIAQAMALQGWIGCSAPGRISRYRITTAGRTAYARMVGEGDRAAHAGFAEARAEFDHPARRAAREENAPPPRFFQTETPVAALGRRRDKGGAAFLDKAQLDAADRLREDYEIARLGGDGIGDIDAMMRGLSQIAPAAGDRPEEARQRLAEALADLGPGLGDMAVRCCCRLEGLETAEQSLGWSARSGKIVLRIALQRLARHYAQLGRAGRGMIG